MPTDESLSEVKVKEMIDRAVRLVWEMMTLIPPAIVYQPTEYKEEWHKKQITSWNDDLPCNAVVYYRPVLLYSALGHVGCQGAIGNEPQASNMTLIKNKSNIQDEGQK